MKSRSPIRPRWRCCRPSAACIATMPPALRAARCITIFRLLFLLGQGDFVGAALKFMETSNFPDVCGRICPQEKQCEGSCVIANRNPAVCIGKLEAFVIDYVRKNYGYPRREKAAPTGMKVAVVGAGPAGLAVAEELAVLGHQVVVYDMWPYPGGLLLYGIPNFKLNKAIVFAKIRCL